MTFVDAGFLIAIFNPADALHTRASGWAHRVQGRQVVTSMTWTEAIDHFSASTLRVRTAGLLQEYRRLPFVEFMMVDEALLDRGLQLHRDRPDKAWSLTDCVSFVVMRERGVTEALAYDHHFEQAGFVPLLRREPSAI